jgi:hypothetical protein
MGLTTSAFIQVLLAIRADVMGRITAASRPTPRPRPILGPSEKAHQTTIGGQTV